jgi:hypothetical protein
MARNGISFEQKAARMREAHSETSLTAFPSAAFTERHYTPAEIATRWNLSQDAVRNIFQNEPGVLVLGNAETRHRRRYTTLRIPESVVARVHRRMSKV